MIGNKPTYKAGAGAGNDTTKFPTVFLGNLTDTNTLEDIVNNFNLVVEKGIAPILFVSGSPVKSATIQAVTRRYLWKLGSGTFAPIGSADLDTKLELIDEKYLTSNDFELILAQPNVQQTDLGIIAVDFMEYMNTTASYNFTNDEVTHVITFTKDDVDYAYFFAGIAGIYGLGNTPINSNDVIFIYQSGSNNNLIDDEVISPSKTFSSEKIDGILYEDKSVTIDRLIISDDLKDNVVNNYNFYVNAGSVFVSNASGNSVPIFGTQVFQEKIIELKCNVTNRFFFIIGYNSPTEVCAVIIRNLNTGLFGRVVNINTVTNTFVTIENTVSADVALNGEAKIIKNGNSIEIYKGVTLSKTLNYTTLSGSGAFVNNKHLGLCIYDVSTTYQDNSLIASNVSLKSLSFTEKTEIFAKINNDLASDKTTYSSEKIEALLSNQLGKIFSLNVSILGDSLSTTAYGGVNSLNYWIGLLQSQLNWTTYVNAVSGTPIAELSGFNSFVTDARWQTLNDSFMPDAIIIFGGTNDFGARNIPLGTIADDPITNKTNFYGGLKYLLGSICNDNKTTKIFFMLPIQMANRGFPQYNTTTGNFFSQYINAIKEVCELYGVSVIDTFQDSGLNYFNMTAGGDYSTDGLHLNALGHSLLAKTVINALNNKF